jgi:hypothetical protein
VGLSVVRAIQVWAIALSSSGCILSDVDLTGKRCDPTGGCASGYYCDGTRCLPLSAQDGGLIADAAIDDLGVPPDAALPDASPGDASDASPSDTSPSDAPSGMDAQAMDASPLGTDCTQNTQCASGFCLAVHANGPTRQFCTTACGATSDCPIHFSCRPVNWMGFCLREDVFQPPATFTTPSGGQCMGTTNTCESGVCNTGTNQCVESCGRESDCARFGGNCWTWTMGGDEDICFHPNTGAAIGAACTLNTDCITTICDATSNVCAAHCCADADCAPAESCDVLTYTASAGATLVATKRICRPRSPMAGTKTPGQSCTTNLDCESEVCAAIHTSDPGGARQCSTFCCKDSDCAVLPSGGICLAATGPNNSWVGTCFTN